MDSQSGRPAPARRQWLCGGIAAGGLLALGRVAAARAEIDLEQWLRAAPAQGLGDRAALRRLGALYLQDQPAEADRRRLAALLGAARARAGDVPRVLVERIARDWREHDVAWVDGWLLARTEARLCALLALLEAAGA